MAFNGSASLRSVVAAIILAIASACTGSTGATTSPAAPRSQQRRSPCPKS